MGWTQICHGKSFRHDLPASVTVTVHVKAKHSVLALWSSLGQRGEERGSVTGGEREGGREGEREEGGTRNSL